MSPPRATVLLTRDLPPDWIRTLREQTDLHVGDPATLSSSADLRAKLARAEGILSLLTERIDVEVLDAAPNLRVVSNMAVGIDNIDVVACTDRGIPVGHTPGVLTDATADLTMALLLAATRRLPAAHLDARAGKWTTWSPTQWLGLELRGATLGIVGLGKIGTAVAERAAAFGMRILYSSRGESPPRVRLGTTTARGIDLATLLRESDVVSLHVPLTTATHHLIDAAALASMKSGAYLINTARGPIVDPVALRSALEVGTIAGAALDVTCPEPLPPGHPLWTVPNLFIVPHIGSATSQTRRAMAELAVANLLAGLAGAPLLHQVPTRGAPAS